MATDLRGLFQNNRRREHNAVTVTVPAVITPADLRTGTAAVLAAAGTYTLLTIPAGSVISRAYLVIDDAYDSTTATIAVSIGATAVLTATTCKVVGLTASTGGLPLLITAPPDVVATSALTGTVTTGTAKFVIEFVDYDRATMSYIGVK